MSNLAIHCNETATSKLYVVAFVIKLQITVILSEIYANGL